MQTANPLRYPNPQPLPNSLNPLYQFYPRLGGEVTGALSPYFPGNRIVLRLHRPSRMQTVICKVIHVFEPFDIACIISVTLEQPPKGLEGLLIVRIYDRRFAIAQRLRHRCEYWSHDIEVGFRDFIRDRDSSVYFESPSTEVLDGEVSERWCIGRREARFNAVMQKYYTTELETYHKVKDLQGRYIPGCFGTVHLPWEVQGKPGYPLRWSCPGLLVQYITGFPLERLAYYMPRQGWQSVCEDAAQVEKILKDRGLQDLDTNPKNFVVWPENPRGPFKVMMLNLVRRNIPKNGTDDLEMRPVKPEPDTKKFRESTTPEILDGDFRIR
ncbi:hypothetical protein BO94DRAFT_622557 [Aspergillus sclerotioniger CBS 115572]|uniref:Uncharacterized protein n=1 Tax=Aspergillus sclerotioniger CBS 115572 TaxID=1450535 RepID=A0A317X0N4_9EURO|nr:hypothetical protein BO94DRAFT_622557 [Aspergillus sclerotioniger CBS 115572]PWY91731.1 hypothetical protein BO94DRAFT_622557 [Aspergillus sclerotioniger CBS 115572]